MVPEKKQLEMSKNAILEEYSCSGRVPPRFVLEAFKSVKLETVQSSEGNDPEISVCDMWICSKPVDRPISVGRVPVS